MNSWKVTPPELAEWLPWDSNVEPVAGMLVRMPDDTIILVGDANDSKVMCDGCIHTFDQHEMPVSYCIVWEEIESPEHT